MANILVSMMKLRFVMKKSVDKGGLSSYDSIWLAITNYYLTPEVSEN